MTAYKSPPGRHLESDIKRQVQEDWWLVKLSSSEEGKKDRDSRLKLLRPKKERFSKADEYHTIRLKNTSPRYDLKIASRNARLVEKLSSQLKKTAFPDVDLISTSDVLEKFRGVCDCNGNLNRAATRLISYFLERPAS